MSNTLEQSPQLVQRNSPVEMPKKFRVLSSFVRSTVAALCLTGCSSALVPVPTGEQVRVGGVQKNACSYQQIPTYSLFGGNSGYTIVEDTIKIDPSVFFTKSLPPQELSTLTQRMIGDFQQLTEHAQSILNNIDAHNKDQALARLDEQTTAYVNTAFQTLSLHYSTLPSCYDPSINSTGLHALPFVQKFLELQGYRLIEGMETTNMLDGTTLEYVSLSLEKVNCVKDIVKKAESVGKENVQCYKAQEALPEDHMMLKSELASLQKEFPQYFPSLLQVPKSITMSETNKVASFAAQAGMARGDRIFLQVDGLHSQQEGYSLELHEYAHSMFYEGNLPKMAHQRFKELGYQSQYPQLYVKDLQVHMDMLSATEAISNLIQIRYLIQHDDPVGIQTIFDRIGVQHQSYAYLGQLLFTEFREFFQKAYARDPSLNTIQQQFMDEIGKEELMHRITLLIQRSFRDAEMYLNHSFSKNQEKQ